VHATSTKSAKTPGWLEIRGRDCVLHARIQPRSSRECIDGVRDGRLLVRVCAAPVEGAANERMLRVLAHALGVPKTDLSLLRGAKSRLKDVFIKNGAAAAEQFLGKI
jgi:uncharacterized protein (TIGR00251 family)